MPETVDEIIARMKREGKTVLEVKQYLNSLNADVSWLYIRAQYNRSN